MCCDVLGALECLEKGEHQFLVYDVAGLVNNSV